MTSTNQAIVPVIQDLRVIALAWGKNEFSTSWRWKSSL
jgi:hypothetical protein